MQKYGIPDLFDYRIPEPRMTEIDPRLTALLRGHNRVWLIYSHSLYTDPIGLIPKTLAAEWQLVQKRDFYGVQVQLYENR